MLVQDTTLGPGGCHTPLSLLCLNWFCQDRATRQGAPPAILSLLLRSSQGPAPLHCEGSGPRLLREGR